MPTYRYTAADESGKTHKGVADAADEAELQLRMKAEGRYLQQARLVENEKGKRLKASQLSDFSQQVGSLTGAGISLARTLSIISEEESVKPRTRLTYIALNRLVRQGTQLSQAMQEVGVFPPLLVHMFRAAEAGGNLSETALQMAEHYRKEEKLRAKIKTSTVYPKLLAVLIVVAVCIIMVAVMPKFKELFAQLDELPVVTRFLFWLSDLIVNGWYILLPVLAVILLALSVLFHTAQLRLFKDKLKLQLPVVGKLLRIVYTARFARTLSSLYACGLSLVEAVQIAKDTVGNTYIEAQFDELVRNVRSGQLLSEGLRKVDGFSKKLSSAVKVGEESGQLSELLRNIADTFDYDAGLSIDRLVALVEPLMIVVMAVIIALIIFGVITPIYSSMGAIGALA